MANRLNPGEQIAVNQNLWSSNGKFMLILQTDGNLVEYLEVVGVWASHTWGRKPNAAVMQLDGNFVIYEPGGIPIWASTTGVPGSYFMLHDDGNMVVHHPQGAALWSSGPVSVTDRLRVRVGEIYCQDPEDKGDGDEFYLVGGAVLDDGTPNPQAFGLATVPLNMKSGYRRYVPLDQGVMFDGRAPAKSTLRCVFRAFDEDVAHDWRNRPEMVDKISGGLATAAGAAIGGGIATLAWPAIIGGAVTLGVIGVIYATAGGDRDDELGAFYADIPSRGAPKQELWEFRRDDWTGYSSWRYQVTLVIERP